jgi:uncharacterized membrane protein YbhN (UPF0104 family)
MSLNQIATTTTLLLASYLARSARLFVYLSTEIPAQFVQCVRIILQHNLFINILPLRAGEASFPLLIKRHFGIPLSRSAGTLFSFRVADLIVLSILGLISIATGLQLGDQADTATKLLFILLSTIFLMLFALYKFGRAIPWINHYWDCFKAGLPTGPRVIFVLLFWTFLTWSTKLLAYASIILAFLHIDTPIALLCALSGELASSIPIHTPAAFGTFESGVVAVLLPAGINIESALTVAINLHLFILSITIIFAGLGELLRRRTNDTR